MTTCSMPGVTFVTANKLDSKEDQQNVGPLLDPNYLTLMVILKDFFEKFISKTIAKT